MRGVGLQNGQSFKSHLVLGKGSEVVKMDFTFVSPFSIILMLISLLLFSSLSLLLNALANPPLGVGGQTKLLCKVWCFGRFFATSFGVFEFSLT